MRRLTPQVRPAAEEIGYTVGSSQIRGSSVISKVNAILTAVSEDGVFTLSELAVGAGLPLSTVHRLANEMAAWNILERDENGRFRVNSRFTRRPPTDEPNNDIANSAGLRRRLAPVLDELFRATGAQVRAGVLEGFEVAYIEKTARQVPVTSFSPAARLPAHATALGKALLAFSPPVKADLLVARGLERYTAATLRADQLRSALREVRLTRIAVASGELDADWNGMATPVIGPGGTAVVAIELRLDNTDDALSRSRAVLTIAASWLGRELLPDDIPSLSMAEGLVGIGRSSLGRP
jgi:DNA-binding IclR family transcriptional regulator